MRRLRVGFGVLLDCRFVYRPVPIPWPRISKMEGKEIVTNTLEGTKPSISTSRGESP
jgi:hypothetical protein